MVISFDIAAEPAPDRIRTPIFVRATLAIGLVAALFVTVTIISAGPPTRAGRQVSSTAEIALRQAPVDGWEPLVPTSGQLRAGFPEPMVWRSDRVCLGFARADFGDDIRRPSLARCERQPPDRPLAVDEIRLLHSMESGFDTWHFLEAADRVDAVDISMSSGAPLSGDRIHLSDSTIALRLEVGRDLLSISWSTRAQTFECLTDPTAWQTSQFCPAGSP